MATVPDDTSDEGGGSSRHNSQFNLSMHPYNIILLKQTLPYLLTLFTVHKYALAYPRSHGNRREAPRGGRLAGTIGRPVHGQKRPKTVQDQAANADSEVQKNLMCEANFYLGQWHLLKHKKEEARALFQQAQDGCSKRFVEYDDTLAELKRM